MSPCRSRRPVVLARGTRAASLAFALGLLACCGTALGQSEKQLGRKVATANAASPAENSHQVIDGIDFTLRATGDISFQTDLRDNPGSVAVYRAGGELNIAGSPFENWRLSLNLAEEASWYNFRGATTIIAGTSQPFREMHRFAITPTATHIIDKEWSYVVGGLFDFSFERDAGLGDSFTAGGFTAVRYAFNDRLALSVGILAKTRLEKNALYVPIVALDWKINDKVTLTTRGLGGQITYTFSPRWQFELFGDYESREYRLDDVGPNPNGVTRDRRAPVGVGVTWKPCDFAEVFVRGGAIVYQEFRTDNNAGINQTEVRSDPTGFIQFGAAIRF